ncbi:MAG: hypothetical protein B1H03_02160 [Planctomycetales bacterium 4484_113]|nr:MAG: hypothetical protein B1H03_02160 [Planctomycetales bacterium 4484_113]
MIERGDPVGAIRALLKELQGDPSYIGAFYNVGLAFKALELPQLARMAFELYLELEPQGYWSLQAEAELARMDER